MSFVCESLTEGNWTQSLRMSDRGYWYSEHLLESAKSFVPKEDGIEFVG